MRESAREEQPTVNNGSMMWFGKLHTLRTKPIPLVPPTNVLLLNATQALRRLNHFCSSSCDTTVKT